MLFFALIFVVLGSTACFLLAPSFLHTSFDGKKSDAQKSTEPERQKRSIPKPPPLTSRIEGQGLVGFPEQRPIEFSLDKNNRFNEPWTEKKYLYESPKVVPSSRHFLLRKTNFSLKKAWLFHEIFKAPYLDR